MKVLLTIWISVVLIQEVVPSTLVRRPRSSPTSLVHTEYEAKYEQKGRHGNDSVSTVSGKQQILHDNCSENWNAFADKCASLIKDLVASLANAVHSKPGDATKMQLQIKNTFSHLDKTHNCTCLNHTEQALSDLDLSPLINNITINTVAPALTRNVNGDGQESNQCGLNGGSCDEHNDQKEIPVFVTPVPHLKRMSNGLVDIENNAMDPSNPENSNDGLTSNSRRQVNYPQVSRQPDNKVSPLFIVTPRPIYPAKSLQTPVIASDASPAIEKTVPVISTTSGNDIPTSAAQVASPVSRNNKGIPPGVVTESHLSPNNIARRLITSPVVVPGKNYGVPDQPSQTSQPNVVFPVQPAVPLPLTQKRASQPSLVAPIGPETSNVEPSGHASEPSLVVPTQTHASSPMIPIINSNSNLPESPEFNEETLKPTPINPNPQSKVLVTNNQPAVGSLKRPEGIIPVTHIPVYPVDPVAIAPVTQNLPNSQNVNSPIGNALALGQPEQSIEAGEPGTSQENCEDSNTNNNKTPVLPVAAVAPLTPVLPVGNQNTAGEPGTTGCTENCDDSGTNTNDTPLVSVDPVAPAENQNTAGELGSTGCEGNCESSDTNDNSFPVLPVAPVVPVTPVVAVANQNIEGEPDDTGCEENCEDSFTNTPVVPVAPVLPAGKQNTEVEPGTTDCQENCEDSNIGAPVVPVAPVLPVVPVGNQNTAEESSDTDCQENCEDSNTGAPVVPVAPVLPVVPVGNQNTAEESSDTECHENCEDSNTSNINTPVVPVAPVIPLAPAENHNTAGESGTAGCQENCEDSNTSNINTPVVPVAPVIPLVPAENHNTAGESGTAGCQENCEDSNTSGNNIPVPLVAPLDPVTPVLPLGNQNTAEEPGTTGCEENCKDSNQNTPVVPVVSVTPLAPVLPIEKQNTAEESSDTECHENCEDSNASDTNTPEVPVAPVIPVVPVENHNTAGESGTAGCQENCEDSNKNLPVVAAAPVSPLDPITNNNNSPSTSVTPALIAPVDPITNNNDAPLSSAIPVDSVINNGNAPLSSAVPIAPIPAAAPVAPIKVPEADQLTLGNPGDENCDDSSNNGNNSPLNSVAPIAPVHPMTGATTPAYVVPVNPLPTASQVTEPQNGESGFPNGVGLTAPIPVYPQTNLPTAHTAGCSENCAEDSSNEPTQQHQPSVIPISDSGVPEESPGLFELLKQNSQDDTESDENVSNFLALLHKSETDNTPVAQVITPNELQPEVTPTGGEQSGILSQHGQHPTVLQPVKPVALLPNGAQQSGHGAPSSSLIPATVGAQPTAPITNTYPESQPIPAVQPTVVVPNGAHQENIEDPILLKPTTYQTTSVEPTPPPPPIFLSPTESTKPLPQTSLPQTLLTNPSSSPKTSLPHDDDDDDDEDCCSCESCTEEEITDPKAYKENACKNLEEARRELKLIFDKIKKNLRCGRKAPQITTTAATTTQLHTPFSSSPVV